MTLTRLCQPSQDGDDLQVRPVRPHCEDFPAAFAASPSNSTAAQHFSDRIPEVVDPSASLRAQL